MLEVRPLIQKRAPEIPPGSHALRGSQHRWLCHFGHGNEKPSQHRQYNMARMHRLTKGLSLALFCVRRKRLLLSHLPKLPPPQIRLPKLQPPKIHCYQALEKSAIFNEKTSCSRPPALAIMPSSMQNTLRTRSSAWLTLQGPSNALIKKIVKRRRP